MQIMVISTGMILKSMLSGIKQINKMFMSILTNS